MQGRPAVPGAAYVHQTDGLGCRGTARTGDTCDGNSELDPRAATGSLSHLAGYRLTHRAMFLQVALPDTQEFHFSGI